MRTPLPVLPPVGVPTRGPRFMPRENYHVTLAFLVDIGEAEARGAMDALDEAAAAAAPIDLVPQGLGTFGRPRDATLFLALAPDPALVDLAARLRAALSARGIGFDAKAFRPHVTLARRARLGATLDGARRRDGLDLGPDGDSLRGAGFGASAGDDGRDHGGGDVCGMARVLLLDALAHGLHAPFDDAPHDGGRGAVPREFRHSHDGARKLNELITSSVLADAENTRLVERLRIEVQRSENARRATQKESERRARFFAAANHDLRQPLQAMGIYLDILKRKCTPATKPVVDQLALTSASISTLVEQVLEVTRMEFGGQEPHIERMELAPLFSRLEAEFGPAAKVKGLVFRTVPTNVAVDADPVMLERALKNLIANAINYSNPKNPRPEVVVAARRLMVKGRRFVRIGVYDCGDGMTKEERGKIFDAFFRGEAGKRRPGSGFGLGLSIVRGIAEALHAELTIDSHPGRGSVFRLGFPEASSPRSEVESAPAPVRDPARSFTGTIALVEDNPILRNALLPVFESRGATVLAAAVADEEFFAALSEKEGEVAALVTDYNLGEDEMTGLEVAALVEARLGRTIPVVVLTAVAREEIEAHFRSMREAGVLTLSRFPVILQKPADTDDILAAIWSQQSGPQPKGTKNNE